MGEDPVRTFKARGCLMATFVWIVIAALLAVAYKFFVAPRLAKTLEEKTGSEGHYTHELTCLADSFSGYAILRSDHMKNRLKSQGIRWTVKDDKGDFESRWKELKNGKAPLAVFTIDSLLKLGARARSFPGSIILVLDETRGADAIVAYKKALPSLQDLDDPAARLVLTPDSPSEFLARIVVAHFNLPALPKDPFEKASGAGEVLAKMKKASPEEKKAFVLWEPYLSKALKLPGAHLLLDTSKIKGHIVDVLVARREWLRDDPERARAVLEAYLRAAFALSRQPNGLRQLVLDDAARAGEKVSPEEAEKLVQGIAWKNTLENYAHFGLVQGTPIGGQGTLEDMIGNITQVLIRTGALASDPLEGKPATLFFDQILRQMQNEKFHPGQNFEPLPGLGPELNAMETVRDEKKLKVLSEALWERLIPVGTLRAEPILFARGGSEVNITAQAALDRLASQLKAWPQFYLLVLGTTRSEGDPEANRLLAEARAQSVREYLIAKGIEEHRVKASTAPPKGNEGESQAVSFLVGQAPY